MGNPYRAKFTDDNNQLRVDGSVTFSDAANQPGGGGSLIDLGLVNIRDIVLGGPQTLYTPAVGKLVEIFLSHAGFVAFLPITGIYDIHISQNTGLTSGEPPEGVVAGLAPINGVGLLRPVPYSALAPPYVTSSTDPFVAFAVTATNGFNMTAALAVWAAAHAYAAEATILGPDTHVWSSSGGTSGGSIPDFAANEGGTVADNTIIWTDEGVVPTQGAARFYARVTA